MPQFNLLPLSEKDGQLTFLQPPDMLDEHGQFTFLPRTKADLPVPDVSALFESPVWTERLLPEAFEDACRDCERKMKRVPSGFWGTHRPHATFHCEDCSLFLYIFTALPKDLLVWSDRLRNAINIERRINELLADRERKDTKRKIRHGKTAPP